MSLIVDYPIGSECMRIEEYFASSLNQELLSGGELTPVKIIIYDNLCS